MDIDCDETPTIRDPMDDSLEKAPTPDDAPAHRLVDAPTLLSVCGGDPALLAKMVRSFEIHCWTELGELRDAIQAEDRQLLANSAHKLRGLVSAFSTTASDAVRIMEEFPATGQWRGVKEHYVSVLQMMCSLRESLSHLGVPDLVQLADAGTITAGIALVGLAPADAPATEVDASPQLPHRAHQQR